MRDENGKVICDAHFFGTLVPFDSQISDGNGSNPMPKIGFYDYLTFATLAIVGIGSAQQQSSARETRQILLVPK